MAQEKFREDLYYRLSVVPIRVPALRERPHDIQLLAEYFLDDFCARNNFKPKKLDDAVLPMLESYAWPGNARELRNVIERMAILTPGERLTRDSVPVELASRIVEIARQHDAIHDRRADFMIGGFFQSQAEITGKRLVGQAEKIAGYLPSGVRIMMQAGGRTIVFRIVAKLEPDRICQRRMGC